MNRKQWFVAKKKREGQLEPSIALIKKKKKKKHGGQLEPSITLICVSFFQFLCA